MTSKLAVIYLLSLSFFCSCDTRKDCVDMQIEVGFIGFAFSEIDTFILRKFEAGSSFKKQVDSFQLRQGDNAYFTISNDTSIVRVIRPTPTDGIAAWFDWQVYIPARKRTISIFGIESEKRSEKVCRRCQCYNQVYSARVDGQLFNFPNPTAENPRIFIRN